MIKLTDIQFMFNRSIAHVLDFKKWLLTFAVLSLCGVLFVFCSGLALSSGKWVALSLAFLPLFLCFGILLSLGILLIRFYHDEIKKKEFDFKKTFLNSLDELIGASYFAIPVIVCYLLLWMLLGLFFLLKTVPGFGDFIAVILAFCPFILNFASILLLVGCFALLFLATPAIALKGLNRIQVTQTIVKRLSSDPFCNLLFAMIALIPAIFILVLLVVAAFLTGPVCSGCESIPHYVLQSFFIMIPFTALLAPAVIFFFNFTAESQVFFAHGSSAEAKE